MTTLLIEHPLLEAETMFSRVPKLTVEHENFEFLITEIGQELDKADKMLRGHLMSITFEARQIYEARIQAVRVGVKQQLLEIQRHKDRQAALKRTQRWGSF